MDPVLVLGAITAVDTANQRFAPARPRARGRPVPARRIRRTAAVTLHRVADRLEPRMA